MRMSDGHPVLRALTPEAEAALRGRQEIEIDRFPFRVGRESRAAPNPVSFDGEERRHRTGAPVNELYLRDENPRKHVSREHFQIERRDDGRFEILDRGSACGTVVGNQTLGGRRQAGRCVLENENVIIAGDSESPYVFQFFVAPE